MKRFVRGSKLHLCFLNLTIFNVMYIYRGLEVVQYYQLQDIALKRNYVVQIEYVCYLT